METAALVRLMWDRFAAHDWPGARAVLADEFVCDYPQTGESFPDADSFIAMNQAHPAPNWRVEAIDIIQGTDGRACARVIVPTDDGVDVCLGCYTSTGDLLSHAIEYWTEHAHIPTPQWRSGWTAPPSSVAAFGAGKAARPAGP